MRSTHITPLGWFFRRHLPRFVTSALRPRTRARRAARAKRIVMQVRETSGDVVQAGPFQGMKYLPRVAAEPFIPKLIGSYEVELHSEIERLVGKGYERVINVGSAEGYYAVGFALRLPEAQVYAFDIDERAQRMCPFLAHMNGVSDRVHVAGECVPDQLNELIVGRTLLFFDCEGCELGLLDPDRAPRLSQADLLVELHDFIDPAISGTLHRRFADTHSIRILDASDRNPDDYPALKLLGSRDQKEALNELKLPRMQWAVIEAGRPGFPASTRPEGPIG